MSPGKKPRKKPNRQMTNEERKYVLANYANRSTSDIADELKLTRQQVYRTVHETRQKAKDRIAALQAEAQTPERDEKISKLEGVLASLPEKPFGGGQGGGAKKGSAVDNVLDELLG
jgi:transposase-like protein